MAEPDFLRFFPYPDTYEHQFEAMTRIADALDTGQDVLFEGACGTGKTLAALAPALEHARREDRTVVITTNVHQQMRQFIAEARAITQTEPIRAVVFRGKSSMCHIDVGYEECQVLRDTTHDYVDLERDIRQLEHRERELLDQTQTGDTEAAQARTAVMDELTTLEEELSELENRATCEHYYQNLTGAHDFESWLFDDVRTPDDVYAYADDRTLCGYELLKDAMEAVDLVVCNYHHLLDPVIRTQFFRWLDREPTDVITVFDEAHNVEREAREHATQACSERTFASALDELADLSDTRTTAATNAIHAFHTALTTTYDRLIDPTIIEDYWTDVPIENDDRRDDLTLAFLDNYTGAGIEHDLETALELGRMLDEEYEQAYRDGDTTSRRDSHTLAAAEFIHSYLDQSDRPEQYPIITVRRDATTGEVYGRAELYTCIPRSVTQPLFAEVHASVLMSATLRPFDVTADVLGLDAPTTMAYGLSFPEANRRTYAVDVPPLFASRREDPSIQSTVTSVIEDAIEFTPGNTLVFFPSYAEADRYADHLDQPVYLDEPNTRVDDLRADFTASSNAALFTSLWGTLTEGVSFDGDDAHTVVVVGVPYPHLDDRLDAVQAAYDTVFPSENGWEYAVEIPTVRKTRQALGRILRSPTEIGTRILVDRRYTTADMGEYSVRDTFPPDERDELIDIAPSKLKYALSNFYADHNAWDGSRPTP